MELPNQINMPSTSMLLASAIYDRRSIVCWYSQMIYMITANNAGGISMMKRNQPIISQAWLKLALCLFIFIVATPIIINSQENRITAVSTVEAFCREDFNGARLSTGNEQAINELGFWEWEPGWDGIDVISGFRTTEVSCSGDTAKVLIEYDLLGAVYPSRFYRYQETDKDLVMWKGITPRLITLIMDETGWHNIDSIGPPKVSPESMLRELKHMQQEEQQAPSDTTRWDDAIEALQEVIAYPPPVTVRSNISEQTQPPRPYLSTPDSTLYAFHRFYNNNDKDSLLTCLLDLHPEQDTDFIIHTSWSMTIVEVKNKKVFTNRDLESPNDRVGDVEFDVLHLIRRRGEPEGRTEMWSCWMRNVHGEWLIYDMAAWGYPN